MPSWSTTALVQPSQEALDAFMDKTQERVTGWVRVKLYKGSCVPVGRWSPYSLYRLDLATYEKVSTFDNEPVKASSRFSVCLQS
jgi:argininosuccinate synthase